MKPDLAAIKARDDKATGGPWHAGRMDTVSSHGDGKYFKNVYCDAIKPEYHLGLPLPEEIASAYDANGVDCRANADFIANARQDIPALLAYIEQLEAERQWVSCRDRLPESGRPIDVWIIEDDYGRRSIDAEYDAEERLFDTDEGDFEADDGTEIDGIVTHWMYQPADPEILPPLPEVEK